MNKPLTRDSSCEDLMTYFNQLINFRQESDEPLPVDLEDVWRIGFLTKADAVKEMLNTETLFKDEDYAVFPCKETYFDNYGNIVNNYMISITCLTYMILSKHLPSRMMFEAVKKFRKVNLLR